VSFAHVNSRPSRTKLFGSGRPRPLDREAKVRVMHRARVLMRRTAKGKAYGAVTAKALAVLQALLWGFHNGKSGLCHPSYETIAERAVPFANLVYLKGALDYMIAYHLFEAASPGWWERTNRRLQKEQGRAMIGYSPGGNVPYGVPGIYLKNQAGQSFGLFGHN
jgi:hypothetical protein